MQSTYKPIGNYISEVNVRNADLKVDRLLGVSIQKVLMPSIANTIGTNMKTYKVLKRNQFAYGPVTSRNGDKISIALLEDYDEAIISQAYTSFEIENTNELLPEYLMMWFRRPEFDRYARFMSHGSAREVFGWEELCNTKLPVPSIEKQRAIVAEYNTVKNRIALNNQLIQKLEEAAQSVYKQWFVDFEFPNENGKPYKSSGGKMVYNEELEKEIPEGWELRLLSTLSTIKGGKRMPSGIELSSKKNQHPYIKVADMGTGKYVFLSNKFEYVPKETQIKIARYIVSRGDVIISIVGTIGIVKIIHDSLHNANLTENCVKITNLNKINSSYLYHYFLSNEGKDQIATRNVGAVQAKLPIYNIESLPILCSEQNILDDFAKFSRVIDNSICDLETENLLLEKQRDLLLSKLATIEN